MNQWNEGVSGYTIFRPSLRTVCKGKACKVLIRSCHIPTSIYPTSLYATISPPLVISLQMFQPPSLWISLVPRPHCLIRRNDLVNRVKFLGLVHTFATMSPSNPLKKGTHIQVDFTVVKDVLHNIIDLAISLVIITIGNKPKKFNCVHQTVSHWEAHTGWA